MKNKAGFSLVELLVSIIIASIIILTAGGISRISLNSYYKTFNKQQIHNDLSYGLKLLRNRFRNAEASSVRKNTSASDSWVDKTRLEIGGEAFGIFKPNKSSRRDFVHLPDKSKENNENDREVLATVPDGDLMWAVTCDPPCLDSATCDSSCLGPNALTVVVKRVSNNNAIPFDMETTIARRNP